MRTSLLVTLRFIGLSLETVTCSESETAPLIAPVWKQLVRFPFSCVEHLFPQGTG